MSFLNFSGNKNKQNQEHQPTLFENQAATDNSAQEENEPLDEGVPATTKLKIFAALFIVGLAGYVAFWVQSPSEIQTDVFNGSSQAQVALDNGQTQQVSMIDFSFDPSNLHIQKGTTIVWTNKDAVPHNVTADTFSSGTLSPGQTFSYTFAQNGIYDYHCSFHPQMKGSIMVDDNPDETQAVIDSQTQAPVAENFHGAADMTDSQIMPPLNTLNSSDQSLMTESQSSSVDPTLLADSSQQNDNQLVASNETLQTSTSIPEAEHGAAVEPLSVSAKKIVHATNFGKISNSGPEDYLYLGIFGTILFLNRKKPLLINKRFFE